MREHIANACDLLRQLQNAPCQHFSYDDLHRFCGRCWAELDWLEIAGEESLLSALNAMDGDAEVASVVALLLAESQNGQPGASEKAMALLDHESPEIRQAAWRGLRLAVCQHVEPHLRAAWETQVGFRVRRRAGPSGLPSSARAGRVSAHRRTRRAQRSRGCSRRPAAGCVALGRRRT